MIGTFTVVFNLLKQKTEIFKINFVHSKAL